MRFTTILGLLFVTAVLILTIVAVNQDWFTIDEPVGSGEPVVVLTADDVTELTIAATGRPSIRLLNHGGQWRILAPLHGRADSQHIQRVIRAMLEMRIARLYAPADPKRPTVKIAGLNTPRCVATITGRSGATYTLRFGARPPLVRQTYAQVDGTTDILLVAPDPTDELSRPLGDFRLATLLEFDPSRVRRMIVGGRENYMLSVADDSWRISAGPVRDAVADTDQVSALITALHELQITGVVPAPATDLKAFGLAPPAVSFRLELEPPPGPRARPRDATDLIGLDVVQFAVGTHEGVVYAMLGDDPWLMTLGPETLRILPPSLKTLRDRRILPIEPAEIIRIALHRDRGTAMLQRRDRRWVDAAGTPIDARPVKRLLADLTEPRVTDFVSSYTSLAGFGLASPRVRLICTDRDGVDRTILIGDADSRQRVYVAVDGDRTVLMAHAPELAAATGEP